MKSLNILILGESAPFFKREIEKGVSSCNLGVNKMYDLWWGADEALSLKGVVKKKGRFIQEADLGRIKKPYILSDHRQIYFVGTQKGFETYRTSKKIKISQIKERKIVGHVLPGFVESHTHLIFSGTRQKEFELRNQGVSYQEIAQQGGGIVSTVKLTQKASEEQLLKLAQKRVEGFKKQGVVLLEVKSGYGLSFKDEIKILKVINQLKGLEVIPCFLGLHAIPQGYTKEDYVRRVLTEWLPEIQKQKLSKRADIFVEKKYFDSSDLKALRDAIQPWKWSFCVHADQFNPLGSSLKAAQWGAQSIEHCVHMSEGEIQKVASTATVFNLLPAADFYLKMKYPNARYMIDCGGQVSLATDYNPGSSPTQNINFVGVLARLEMKMTLAEVIAAYTYNAATVLGKQDSYGALLSGFVPRFQILDKEWSELFYQV